VQRTSGRLVVMAYDQRRQGNENEHLPARDDSALLAGDIVDLRWFWQDAEAECGVRSNFGAQLEASYLWPDDARTARRSEWSWNGPRAEAYEGANEAALSEDDFAMAFDPAYGPVHVHETRSLHWSDPYDDIQLGAVRRANRIRATLRSMRLPNVFVLFAVYGQRRADDETTDLRTRFGDLVGIVTAAVKASMQDLALAESNGEETQYKRWGIYSTTSTTPLARFHFAKHAIAYKRIAYPRRKEIVVRPIPWSTPPTNWLDARAIACSHLSDSTFVRMQKLSAQKLIERAGEDYVKRAPRYCEDCRRRVSDEDPHARSCPGLLHERFHGRIGQPRKGR